MADSVDEREPGPAPPLSRWSTSKRFAVAAIVGITVLTAAAIVAFLILRRDTPAPASLGEAPQDSAGGPSSPDGTWTLAADGKSFVGYRTRERIGPVLTPGDSVGRTTKLTGELVIANDTVTAVKVTADMTQVRSNTDLRDESMKTNGLETDTFREATFELTEPVRDLKATRGTVVEFDAVGDLTLHGVTRRVQAAIEARWNGPSIQVAGSIPIELAAFDIDVATGPDFAGLHVNGRGTAEFELVFAPSTTTADVGEIETLRHDPEATPVFGPPDPPCTEQHATSGALVFGSPRDVPEEGDDFWRVNADGSGLTQLTDTPAVLELDPAASPDGTMIAYSALDLASGAPTVWVMDADGSNQHQLITTGPPAQLAPAWSPDGSKLVFSGGTLDVPYDVQLFVANADGTAVEQLTTSDGRFHGAAAWSPDNTTIAYESYGQQGADELFVVSVTSRESTRLTDDPGYDSSPEWLDDTTLLFSRDARLARIHLATKAIELGADESVGYGLPKLSPDRTTVLLLRSGNLYTTTLDGRDRVCLSVGRTANAGDWLPP